MYMCIYIYVFYLPIILWDPDIEELLLHHPVETKAYGYTFDHSSGDGWLVEHWNYHHLKMGQATINGGFNAKDMGNIV